METSTPGFCFNRLVYPLCSPSAERAWAGGKEKELGFCAENLLGELAPSTAAACRVTAVPAALSRFVLPRHPGVEQGLVAWWEQVDAS